jgi:catalase
VRGKAERFADHYTQATLFWTSQTPIEKQHIINAFRFELSRVQTPSIRERMVSGLMNVAPELAEAVAEGLGISPMPEPMPKVLQKKVRPEIKESPRLSLAARPGDGSIRTRRVAIVVADGVAGEPLMALSRQLAAQGAVPRFLGSRLGRVKTSEGTTIEIDATLENMPSVLFDAVVFGDGGAPATALAADGRALEFLKDQYRHCKPILALGAASGLMAKAGIPQALPSGKPDPGLILGDGNDNTFTAFTTALASHRVFARETDPPRV